MQTCRLPLNIYDPASGASSPTKNILYHSGGRIPSLIDQSAREVKIYNGAPESVLEIDDAYFVPGTLCLYNKDGVRILESCVRRGKNLSEILIAGSETITIPTCCRTIYTPVLYLSYLPDHWGHFLTESTSRLWARLSHPELSRMAGFFCTIVNSSLESKYSQFLRHFDLFIGENVYSSSEPVRLRKCFVPVASFSNRGEAYSAHRAVFEHVSRAYVKASDSNSSRPVFLSRTKLVNGTGRILRREIEIDSILSKFGAIVVYPEQLSLEEQIILFNIHNIFIGCWGSAFHNLIFSLQPASCITDVICSNASIGNYLMFDAILGNVANYVDCLAPSPGKKQVWPNLDLEIDVEQFMLYLSEADHLKAVLQNLDLRI